MCSEGASSHRQNLPDKASVAQDFSLIADLSERQGLQKARINFVFQFFYFQFAVNEAAILILLGICQYSMDLTNL